MKDGYRELPLATSPKLALGGDAFFYGVTADNGASNLGFVFRTPINFETGAAGESAVVHDFSPSEGGRPVSLIAGSDGALYGTGVGGAYGSLFKMTTNGVFAQMHVFKEVMGIVRRRRWLRPAAGIFLERPGKAGLTMGVSSIK